MTPQTDSRVARNLLGLSALVAGRGEFMGDPDRLRARAERCQKIANGCANPLDNKAWLKLADDWLIAAKLRERLPELQSDSARARQSKTRAELFGGQEPAGMILTDEELLEESFG